MLLNLSGTVSVYPGILPSFTLAQVLIIYLLFPLHFTWWTDTCDSCVRTNEATL